jgi:hypothetical protein
MIINRKSHYAVIDNKYISKFKFSWEQLDMAWKWLFSCIVARDMRPSVRLITMILTFRGKKIINITFPHRRSLTLHFPIVDNLVNTRVLLQFSNPPLPSALFLKFYSPSALCITFFHLGIPKHVLRMLGVLWGI